MERQALQKWLFRIRVAALMIFPPLYSFSRLEGFCKKHLSKQPSAYLPRRFLANLYRDYGKNQEAKAEFLELRRLGCMTDTDCLDFGQVLFRLEEHAGVVEAMAPVIDRYPGLPNPNWYIAISYEKQEQFGKAARYIRRAIEAGLKQYEAYWHLGYCYASLGSRDEAIDAYRTALRYKPDSNELRRAIASQYISIGRSHLGENAALAVEHLRKALEVNPGDPEATGILAALRDTSPDAWESRKRDGKGTT
jgi:tetratricopeptide (TPR) repeat protein